MCCKGGFVFGDVGGVGVQYDVDVFCIVVCDGGIDLGMDVFQCGQCQVVVVVVFVQWQVVVCGKECVIGYCVQGQWCVLGVVVVCVGVQVVVVGQQVCVDGFMCVVEWIDYVEGVQIKVYVCGDVIQRLLLIVWLVCSGNVDCLGLFCFFSGVGWGS